MIRHGMHVALMTLGMVGLCGAISSDRGYTVTLRLAGGLTLSRLYVTCTAGDFVALNTDATGESTYVSTIYVRKAAIVLVQERTRAATGVSRPCQAFKSAAQVLKNGHLVGPLELGDDRGDTYIGNASVGESSVTLSNYCLARKMIYWDMTDQCSHIRKPLMLALSHIVVITALKNG